MKIKHEDRAIFSKPRSIRIPGSQGGALVVPKGSIFRVVDLEGSQVVDFLTFKLPDLKEKMSMSYTRYRHSGGALAAGDFLYTNDNNRILRIRHDTVKVHDMTYMSCNPGFYSDQGLVGHRNCAENLAEALDRAGYGDVVSRLDLPDPWNLFQNTPNYTLRGLNTSKAGDYIELEALMDVLVVGSSCPYDQKGFNDGKATDVAIEIVKRPDDR